jgi:hypothetical protein
MPVYIGLASRSIRQRLTQHLKNAGTVAKLGGSGRGKLLFLHAELVPGDLEYSKRYLPSLERALIAHAASREAVLMNTHQMGIATLNTGPMFKFKNTGQYATLAGWWPRTMSAVLMPARRVRAAANSRI